jgi:hypothetical protein
MRTLDDDRVWVASLHLEGAALDWYFGFELDYSVVPWRHFAKYINMRFGPPLRHNSLAELKALYHTGTMEDYQRQFSQLLCRAHDVTPHQQVELFTAGLGEPLQTEVELNRPPNLQTTMSLARAHERRLTHTALVAGRPSSKALPLATMSKLGGAPRPRMKRLSSEELAAKRANGECYHCTEKYTTDHKCAGKGVFLIEMDDDADEESMPEELGISLHALTRIDVGNTMKLPVIINGVSLVALVDSGSTHTFIQEGLVDKLGLTVECRSGLSVKVANGDRVPSIGVCRQVAISIDKDTFDISCYTLTMDGFDVVLGVQWLRTLGQILWNFANLTMAFWHKDRAVRWSGIGGPQPQISVLAVTRDLLTTLLDSFNDIFEEPRSLPPPRRHDHRITLLPGTTPIAVKPYYYPQLLKDEIEKQCETMLQQGIIRECSSAYSSPVLLVRKADGSWRFCIDYRELNSKTVKDSFPIPVVEQ